MIGSYIEICLHVSACASHVRYAICDTGYGAQGIGHRIGDIGWRILDRGCRVQVPHHTRLKSDYYTCSNMKRLKRMVLAGMLISIASTAAVILYTSTEHTLPALLEVKPIYLLAAVILHLVSYYIWGYRMSVLCKSLDEHVTPIKCTKIATSSLLMAAITPSSAGGEPVRVYMLTKEGMASGKASAIVVAERLFDAMLLLFALPFSLLLLKSISLELDTMLIFAAILMSVVVVSIAMAIFNHGWFIRAVTNVVQKIFHRIGLGQISDTLISKIRDEIINFKDSFIMCARNGKVHMLLVFALTAVFWIVEFMHIPLILLGLNVPDVFFLIPVIIAIQVVLAIVMVIPVTPGASGFAELSSTALLSMVIPMHLVGIVVICWRAVTYYMNMIVGAFVSIKVVKDMDFIRRVLK